MKVLGYAVLPYTWLRSARKLTGRVRKGLEHGALYLASIQELANLSVQDAIMRSIFNPFKRQYSRAECWLWLQQIASGLRHLHTRDICVIHRDMKPANILIMPDGPGKPRIAKICDFGLVSVSSLLSAYCLLL